MFFCRRAARACRDHSCSPAFAAGCDRHKQLSWHCRPGNPIQQSIMWPCVHSFQHSRHTWQLRPGILVKAKLFRLTPLLGMLVSTSSSTILGCCLRTETFTLSPPRTWWMPTWPTALLPSSWQGEIVASFYHFLRTTEHSCPCYRRLRLWSQVPVFRWIEQLLSRYLCKVSGC